MAKRAKPRARPKRLARRRGTATRVKDSGAAFCGAVDAALKRGEPGAISDDALRRVITAAVKIYAAKVETAAGEIPPFHKRDITATEAVTAVCAMIRAVDLNLFDVAMWFRRPLSGAIEDLERRG